MSKENKNTGIEQFNFTTRVYHALKRSDITTIEKLLELSINKNYKNNIYKIHNIGEKSVEEIIEKVHFIGYQFCDEEKESLNEQISKEELKTTYQQLLKEKQIILQKEKELNNKIQKVIEELFLLKNGEQFSKKKIIKNKYYKK